MSLLSISCSFSIPIDSSIVHANDCWLEIKMDWPDSVEEIFRRVTIIRVATPWAGFKTVTWQAASRQASEGRRGRQAGKQACHERLECLPSSRIALPWPSTAVARHRLSSRPLPLASGPGSSAVSGGARGIERSTWRRAGGRKRALTPFFRASMHHEEKMPIPLLLPLPPDFCCPFGPPRTFRSFFFSSASVWDVLPVPLSFLLSLSRFSFFIFPLVSLSLSFA